ncbi:hypothetical protein [Cryobacterium sp. PH31-O1]|nr:hypothetical protein [Cryobacterium sp. PH31-O1]MDJ0337439.1 hypothetical protein [Cryobacterium sp. PH31-O1]
MAKDYDPKLGTRLVQGPPEHTAAITKIQAAARGDIQTKESTTA